MCGSAGSNFFLMVFVSEVMKVQPWLSYFHRSVFRGIRGNVCVEHFEIPVKFFFFGGEGKRRLMFAKIKPGTERLRAAALK